MPKYIKLGDAKADFEIIDWTYQIGDNIQDETGWVFRFDAKGDISAARNFVNAVLGDADIIGKYVKQE